MEKNPTKKRTKTMGRSLPGKGESMREKWNQTTEKQFDSLIQSNEIVLVDFCGEAYYPRW